MASDQERGTTRRVSLRQVFRLVFVVFSLYLMGDAFFRWDGFRYYASFAEFLPSTALAMILWSVVAISTAMLIWLLFRTFEWFFNRIGWKIKIEHILLFVFIYILLEATFWINIKLKIFYKTKLVVKQLVIFIWDKIRYYASFSEHLPRFVLVTIFWIIIALFAAYLIWLSLRAIEWFCHLKGWKIRVRHLLLMLCIFGSMISAYYIVGNETKPLIEKILFFCLTFVSIWLFRKKAERWVGIIHDRITPLVWLFGIFVILSIPLVAYHTWFKGSEQALSKESSNSSEVDINRPNIILVTFDALTARDMSLYGYHRDTTPFISKWAKNSTVFTMAEAESNSTTQTTASLMTGKRVWTHQTYHTDGSKPLRINVESLPSVLKKNGYFNMAFVVNPHASVKILGISDSFDIAPIATEFSTPVSLLGWKFGIINVFLYRLFGDKIRLYDWIIKKDFIFYKLLFSISNDFSETPVPPEKAFNWFLKVMDGKVQKPFFAWIHVVPPHSPYLPPEPYMGMFNSLPYLRTFKKRNRAGGERVVDIKRARYDEFIRYCDSQFEDFIARLTEKNMLKNTIIILSSDHGESFEHRYYGHGETHLYEQVTHIPLIIKESGQSYGQIINEPIQQIDIPSTILQLADIPTPSWMEGRSLLPLLCGKMFSSTPIFSMTFEKNPSRGHQITNGTIAVLESNYKLIHYLENEESLLFNLKHDPDELDNLFSKKTEVSQHLLTLIQ